MRSPDSAAAACAFCASSIATAVTDTAGRRFCSEGCQSLYQRLGPAAADIDGVDRTGPDGEEPTAADESVRRFLQVDGMHAPTCERFIARTATACDGVHDATASYVTETARVTFDPDRTTVADIAEAVSVAGYDATPREALAADPTVATSRRLAGERERDELLGYRYAAGIIFGSFMLLPYVVLLYPGYLTATFGPGVLGRFGGTLSGDGLLALPVFFVLTSVVLYVTGARLLRGAYVSLRLREPTTDLLVTLPVVGAYVYSTIAFLTGGVNVYYDLTIVITAAVVAATYYATLAKRRAVDRLTDLTFSRVSEARRLAPDGTTRTVAVDALADGDRVLVRAGERIPVDGTLVEDGCTVDESVVTGESLPVPKRPGDEVTGGAVVTDDAAVISVEAGTTSGLDRITDAVWNVQSATHGIQRRADRLAGVLAPAAAGLGLLAGGAVLLTGGGPLAALLAALVVLVAAAPWGLGLATPLTIARSIEAALAHGIVVFDETVFERLRTVDTVVFDKTGTLTTGEMEVVDAAAPDDLLTAAAALERRAAHPAGAAIADAFGAPDPSAAGDGASGTRPTVDAFTTHATGVSGRVDGTDILVGTPALFRDQGWAVGEDYATRAETARRRGRVPVVVGRDGVAEGLVVVGDEPRAGWEAVVTALGDRGVDVVVLTGDDPDAAAFLEQQSDVTRVFAAVPPAGKTAAIRRLAADGTVAMVGDGTNDAPALAAADLGIALGSGTALASDAADLALVDDDLGAVTRAFDLADATRARLRQNDALAFGYNLVALPLALVGALNPLLAIVATLLTVGLVAANAFRDLIGS